MTARARETLVSRRSWLLAGMTVSLSRAFADQALQVRYDGDVVHVAAPSLHFLSGKALERLKDGDVVAYLANLELFDDSKTTSLRVHRGRFVVSYALWEEKFSVTRLGDRTVEGLSAEATEAWCLESLTLNTAGLSRDHYYWLRFDIRTASARDAGFERVKGLSFRDLIDYLGRKESVPARWGPLERRVRLSELPRLAGRGSRG